MDSARRHRPDLLYRIAVWTLPVSLLYGAFLAVYRLLRTPYDRPDFESSFLLVALQVFVIAPVSVAIGFLIMRRAPGNIVGPLVAHFGVATINGGAWAAAGPYLAPVVQFYNQAVAFPVIALTLFYFPSGDTTWRFASRLINLFLIIAPVFSALSILAAPVLEQGLPPNPLHVPALLPFNDALSGGYMFVVTPPLLIAIASVFLRYRASGGRERAQIRWLALAAGSFLLILVGWFTLVTTSVESGDSVEIGMESPLAWLVLLLSATWFWMAIPVAVGIALLRHNLYDIDIIIRRTLVYSILTITLALFYWGGVIVLQALLRPLTGEGNDLAIVATTLAVAALSLPLRRRVQGFIDRRFYRRKYDAARTLADFGRVARDEVDLEVLKARLVGVVEDTMQPTHVSVWLRGSRTAAEERTL
ncbi:MAG TPA: hypothetical protein VFR15_14360 [Chloroflexia bacterium]|nr:hypothetical protein [Chloroflexia bacterium]